MRVLLVNDDGPPSPNSPHVYGLWEALQSQLGWNVSVVLPSSQKSWSGMGFSVHSPASVWYYYPLKGNYDGKMEGTSACWSSTRRPLRDGEVAEWVLLDGSPTTCANVGLHSLSNLRPSEKPESFDLVISGPNFGRNTGTAFALGSGTIGAALAASVSGTKAISLSYGHFQFPTEAMKAAEADYKSSKKKEEHSSSMSSLALSSGSEVVTMAHSLSCQIIAKLYSHWEDEVSVYSVNVPLSYILKEEVVYWTRTWTSQYGQLFTLVDVDASKEDGVAAMPLSAPKAVQQFKFAPNMTTMLQPKAPAEGTDVWALTNGYVSVARLGARFAEVPLSTTRQGRFKM